MDSYFLVIRSSEDADDWMTCDDECESPYRLGFDGEVVQDDPEPARTKMDPTVIILTLLGGTVLGFASLSLWVCLRHGRNPYTGKIRNGFNEMGETGNPYLPGPFGESIGALDRQ